MKKNDNIEWIKQQTKEGWQAILDEIEDRKVRNAVAAVIWWDHFSRRLAINRVDWFDRYLTDWKRSDTVSAEQIKQGLIRCGYTKKEAQARMFYGETYKRKTSYERHARKPVQEREEKEREFARVYRADFDPWNPVSLGRVGQQDKERRQVPVVIGARVRANERGSTTATVSR